MTAPATAAEAVDPADLAGMFDRYARELLRYCTRRVGEQVAEDVVAETFLVAYEQRRPRRPISRGTGRSGRTRTSPRWARRGDDHNPAAGPGPAAGRSLYG
ncbi:MAG TPA: hypothetical protein VF462_07485 [Micromonosporaceae bacterium]